MRKNIMTKILVIMMVVSLLSGCAVPNVAVNIPDKKSAKTDNRPVEDKLEEDIKEEEKQDENKPEEYVDEIADTDSDTGSTADGEADTVISDPIKDEPVNQGITVNKIEFEGMDISTLTEQFRNDIDSLKLQRGYEFWLQDDGSYLILISAGEKLTGGYGIEVGSVEDNEGRTIITVTETEPDPDSMNAMVITYPCVVIKASGITDQFMITDQNQVEYVRLSLEN